MKYYFLISYIVYLSSIGHVQANEFSQQELACIAETGVDKDHIKKVILDNSSRFLTEDDPEFNKFMHCFAVAKNLQDSNGEMKYDNIIQHMSEFPRNQFSGKADDTSPIGLEIATQAVQSCRNLPKGSTYGEIVAKTRNCVDKRIIEMIQKL